MASLTPDELRWAASVGIAPDRARWLASCPKFTRWDFEKKSAADRNLWKNGAFWFLRLQYQGRNICERLSTDLTEARRLKQVRLSQIKAL
jgi:hypothetical protein